MTAPTRPTRPPSRLDDRTCRVDGCPCHHDPKWRPGRRRCDRGFTDPLPGATTPGVHSPGHHQHGLTSPDAVAHCPTCHAHAQRHREATR